jgi:2-keto-3-deoxy-L-fuconate dehydrogenase
MGNRLKGKIAVVTAAGQGIGRAIAEALIFEGATVHATDLNVALLEGLAKAKKRKLDVRSTKAVQAFAAKVGEIDILVNAAGYVHHGTVLDCTEADWDFSFDLNVKSMHRTTQALLPGMLSRAASTGHSASIINIASAVSSVRGVVNRYAYGATKAAVIGLTKAIAADFIKQGLRANAICPGTIQSPSLDGRIAALAVLNSISEAEARQMFIDRQPMARLGTVEEVAAMAVYLASDESSYTTGHVHLIDGGFAL